MQIQQIQKYWHTDNFLWANCNWCTSYLKCWSVIGQQEQVEAGLPLQICLSRFTRWLHTLQQERGVVLFRDNTRTHTTVSGKTCAFLTWSGNTHILYIYIVIRSHSECWCCSNVCVCVIADWDLGVCLQYECKRKQITKPEVLNSWIDLRATYRVNTNTYLCCLCVCVRHQL